MTSFKAAMAVLAVFAAALVGVVVWRAGKPHGPEHSPHVTVMVDRSLSTLSPCESAGGLVARALATAKLDNLSVVGVFATGDALSRGEPVEVASLSGLKSGSAMEAPAASAARDHARISDVVEACARLPRTSTSPLVLAGRRGIEHLRAQGCRRESGCVFFFQTDGEENAEPDVRRSLSGSGDGAVLPTPIDNDGIRGVICGFIETTGEGDLAGTRRRRHSTKSAERMSTVWRALFSSPELVTLQPSCPKATAFGAARTQEARP